MHAIALILSLAASAFAGPYSGTVLSTSTGRQTDNISGYLCIADSSKTYTVCRVMLDGPAGVGAFRGVGSSTYSVVLASGAWMAAGGLRLADGTVFYSTGQISAAAAAEAAARSAADVGLYSALSSTAGALTADISRAVAREDALGVSSGTIYAAVNSTGAALTLESAARAAADSGLYSALSSTAGALTAEQVRAIGRENDIAATAVPYLGATKWTNLGAWGISVASLAVNGAVRIVSPDTAADLVALSVIGNDPGNYVADFDAANSYQGLIIRGAKQSFILGQLGVGSASGGVPTGGLGVAGNVLLGFGTSVISTYTAATGKWDVAGNIGMYGASPTIFMRDINGTQRATFGRSGNQSFINTINDADNNGYFGVQTGNGGNTLTFDASGNLILKAVGTTYIEQQANSGATSADKWRWTVGSTGNINLTNQASNRASIDFFPTNGDVHIFPGDKTSTFSYQTGGLALNGPITATTATFTGQLDVQYFDIGSTRGSGSILLGSDAWAGTVSARTDSRIKYGTIAIPRYTNADVPFMALLGGSYDFMNLVSIGGGTNQMKAATDIYFITGASTNTSGGTTRMSIGSTGQILFGTQGTATVSTVAANGDLSMSGSLASAAGQHRNGGYAVTIPDNSTGTIVMGTTGQHAGLTLLSDDWGYSALVACVYNATASILFQNGTAFTTTITGGKYNVSCDNSGHLFFYNNATSRNPIIVRAVSLTN